MPRPMKQMMMALVLLGATSCAAGNTQLEGEVRDLHSKVQSVENRLRRIEGMVSKAGKGMKGKATKGKATKGKAAKGKATKGKAKGPVSPPDDGGGDGDAVPPG